MRAMLAILMAGGLAAPGEARSGAGGATELIDTHLRRGWEERVLRPAPDAGDEEFLRRVTLDLAGTIPRAQEVERFVADADPGKRGRKIDELLSSPDHAQHWGQVWTVGLLDWELGGSEAYDRNELAEWLGEQFAGNARWNQIAHAMLSATGTPLRNRAANFAVKYLLESPEAFATRMSKTFLGIRLSCARCHDHPFDSWLREDFYGLASFFSRTQLLYRSPDGNGQDVIYEVADSIYGDGLQPDGFKAPMRPRFLNGAESATTLWRQDLAVYVTRSPQFARAFVNRTWAQLMGRGMVHPPDNFSKRNPPSHPELLEELARDFAAGGYDVRRLIRGIVSSKAYQLSSSKEGNDRAQEKYFAHALTKPLSPWQLFNSLVRASGVEEEYAGQEAVLDRDRRAFISEFAGELDGDSSAAHAYMENSQLLLAKLSRDWMEGASGKNSLLATLEGATPDRRVEILYVSVLGRRPTPEQRKLCLEYVGSTAAGDPGQAVRDVFYALVNSHEFNFNH
jgi:hypothetical protein